MNQDSYFHVRRFELVDRVPVIEIAAPVWSTIYIHWKYANDFSGQSIYKRKIYVRQADKGIAVVRAPYPVKPNTWLQVVVDDEKLNQQFTGTLHAPPTDKADEPN